MTTLAIAPSLNRIIAYFGGWPVVIGLLVLVLLAAWLSSRGVKARLRGWLGERYARFCLGRLDAAEYSCLHDLLIPDGKGGWAQIDHVVVGTAGVFVIETKNWQGWIFGTEREPMWTVSYHRTSKVKAQNPLVQNAGHIAALERLEGFPAGVCVNVVFLAGEGKLKKGPVPGVVTERLAAHIRGYTEPRLTRDEAAEVVALLRANDRGQDRAARQAHLVQVRGRGDGATG